MELSVSRLRRSVISGSLWWSFTRPYSSHQFCPSLRWTLRNSLAGSWGRLNGSELWLAQLCSSLEKTWTAGWPLKVPEHVVIIGLFLLCHINRSYTVQMHAHTECIHAYKHTHKQLKQSPLLWILHHLKTAEIAACRLGSYIQVNL